MRLKTLHIQSRFKNIENLKIDFYAREGLSVLIGNNGSGKSNILEAISSVFAGLYDRTHSPDFRYFLEYQLDGKDIKAIYDNIQQSYQIKVNNIDDNIKPEYLPSQVIASYSGEESRLWNNFYEPFYKKYINAIKGATLPKQNLVFINRFYWEIALLTLHFYDFDAYTDIKSFCQNDLGIQSVGDITFKFDAGKLSSFEINPVVGFVQAINPDNNQELTLSLAALKERLPHIEAGKQFFDYLTAASLPKNDKLITSVHFNYNQGLSTTCFSEGEKKLLLVKLILEVIGDENSLILLDEPDSHIHISRKEALQKMLSSYGNRENIITTHSPTLTHCFETKHIVMLNKKDNQDTEIVDSEKQEIISLLTNGIWSYQEQNIFLNTSKDILLVEGPTDEVFILKALNALKKSNSDFEELDFSYMPCGGAAGVEMMLGKFEPKENQTMIAFFDKDQAGVDGVNKIFNRNKNNRYNTDNFAYQKKDNIWISFYPSRPYFRGSNFNVEDYFSKALLNKYVFQGFKGLDSIKSKDSVKRNLAKECGEGKLSDNDFKFFETLFYHILELKSKND